MENFMYLNLPPYLIILSTQLDIPILKHFQLSSLSNCTILHIEGSTANFIKSLQISENKKIISRFHHICYIIDHKITNSQYVKLILLQM